ncbi:MAG: hypothetical protein IJ247_05615 [Bacilli bacterium]|nr:hypothetical protein [Bacilli bacterium]
MERKILKRAGLLVCSAAMLASCTNRNEETPTTSTSISSSISTSISSSQEEPEYKGKDLLYPFDGGEVNEISVEFAEKCMEEVYDTARGKYYLGEWLGDYLYNFILTHNHFTDEEFEYFVSLIVAIVRYGEEYDNGEILASQIWNLLTKLNMDRLYALLREIKNDKRAYAETISVLNKGDRFGTGRGHSYFDANEVLNQEDPGIKTVAENNLEVLGRTPGIHMAWWFEEIVDAALADSGLYLFRLLGTLANSIYGNLNSKEMEFINLMIFEEDRDEYWEKRDEATEYIQENLLEFINHCGNVLADFDISADSWEALFPTLHVVAEKLQANNYFDNNDIIPGEIYNTLKASIDNLFVQLNPNGLRNLFKFLGMFGRAFTQLELNALFGVADEETGEIPPYTTLTDLYNEQFGLLTSEEKTSVKQATAAFGVSFDVVIDELEAAMEAGSLDPVNRILEDSISKQFETRFDVIDRDRYIESSGGFRLVLKQGENFGMNEVTSFLRDKETAGLYIETRWNKSHETDEAKANRSNISVVGDKFDTSTIGQKLARVSFSTYLEGWGSYDFSGFVPYTVVPNTVNYFCMYLDYDFSINNNWMERGKTYEDENHSKVARADDVVSLMHNATYQADFLSLTAYTRNLFVYNKNTKRFNDIARESYYYESASIDVSTLNTSELGRHYIPASQEIYKYEEGERINLGNFPVYFAYDVVEYLPPVISTAGEGFDSEIK